ncbi:exocyst complex component 1-like isoform X2 [Dysidea avara]
MNRSVVSIHRVKLSETKTKGQQEGYRKNKTWRLKELKVVDGKDEHQEVADFDLHFDKTYKWTAASVGEKNSFVSTLWKLCHKYLKDNLPDFIRVDKRRLEDLLQYSEAANTVGREVEEGPEIEEYQELTTREEEDLKSLLSSRPDAFKNAEEFTERLSEELASLDAANIHSIMDSGDQVAQLLDHLQNSLFEVEQMLCHLGDYEALLSQVRDTMEKLEYKYNQMIVENKNLKCLLEVVKTLVKKLDLDPAVERILRHYELKGPSNIEACTNAARQLQNACNMELPPGLSLLQAVTDQKKHFTELTSVFSLRLKTFLVKLFNEQSDKLLEEVSVAHFSVPTLLPHTGIHGDLAPYKDLMLWQKMEWLDNTDHDNRFGSIQEGYCKAMQKAYEAEVAQYIEDLKNRATGKKPEGKKHHHHHHGHKLMSGASSVMDMSRNFASSLMTPSGGSHGSLGRGSSLSDMHNLSLSSVPEEGKMVISKSLEKLIEDIEPVCIAEEKFCSEFFHFPEVEQQQLEVTSQDEQEEAVDGDVVDGGDGNSKQILRIVDTSCFMGPELKSTLSQLFETLLAEVEGFISFSVSIDSYNALYLQLYVMKYAFELKEKIKPSYLDHVLVNSLMTINRLSDDFIKGQLSAIKEMKVPRKGRCGILDCVHSFENFAKRAEDIAGQIKRRYELDTSYKILIKAVFEAIERVAVSHHKTPPNVIRFENYHHLLDLLSKLKIHSLDDSKDECKKKYRHYVEDYVVISLGRPLEKLSLFFEGVEGLIASGTRADQVSYQLDYSKNELRKCIKEYPGKEVKRGLEKLYRKVEKDICEEEGMLQVVWVNIQNAFIKQYKHFTSLIDHCYPDSNITFEFSLEDVEEFFSTSQHAH